VGQVSRSESDPIREESDWQKMKKYVA